MVRAKIAVSIIATIAAIVCLYATNELFSADARTAAPGCSQLASTYLECIGSDHWIVSEQATGAK